MRCQLCKKSRRSATAAARQTRIKLGHQNDNLGQMTDALVEIRQQQNNGVFDVDIGGRGDCGVPELPAAEEPRHRQGGLVGQEWEDRRSR